MVWLLCFPAVAAPVLRLQTLAWVWKPGQATTLASSSTNLGDGTLNLSVSVQSGNTWLTASVDASQCIQFVLDVSALPRGTHTASVTVSAPLAIDAPQVVTVTALVGGGDPVAIDQYLAPGRAAGASFYTGYPTLFPGHCPAGPSVSTTTQDGGAWLAVNFQYRSTLGYFYQTGYIHLRPPANMPPGTYTGSVTQSNYWARTIPVTMRVTTQPIAVPSTPRIDLRLAAGGPAITYPFLPPLTFTNSGMGTLELQGVSAAGEGVSATLQTGQVFVTVDPMSRGPGVYTDGVVTIQCNGANCPVQVPVNLEIVPRAAPIIAYQGVVDNAFFKPRSVAPGDVCILKGEQLSVHSPATATGFPLPTSLGGATVLVNNVLAPLYYTSFGQIAFQMPYGVATGMALVQVLRDDVLSNTVTVNVVAHAPQIVVITNADYHLRDVNNPTKPGETLILWAIGLGATKPLVETGDAAPLYPPAVATNPPMVQIAWRSVTPTFAGLSGGSAGLYQVIVAVPADTPKGIVPVALALPDWYPGDFLLVAVQ